MLRFAVVLALFLSTNAFANSIEISFYHDDGACSESELIFTYNFTGDQGIDLKLCKFAAANSGNMDSVWGVKIGGSCRDISDKSLSGICDYVVGSIEAGRRL